MKSSAGFDPRRLRTPSPGRWRRRICSLFAALLTCLGVALLISAIAGLLGKFSQLAASPAQAIFILFIGAVVACSHLPCKSARN